MYPAVRVMTDMPSIRTVIAVIQICRRLHPEPWYYRRDPIQDGIEFTNLPPVLQYLESEKLVEKAHDPISGEKGVCLSERGLRVADDPAAMERLAEGVAMDPSEVGSVIRAGLRDNTVPWMTRLLVLANVVMFFWGLWLAQQAAVVQPYLAGFMGRSDPRYLQIIHTQGSVSGSDLLDGGWWRVLAANFVHFGLLHLAMNMYALWGLGAFVERSWGRWRFLAIAFVSAVSTVCLSMAYSPPGPAAGASGIDCGILGASAVFAILYSRHLPRQMASSLWTMLITNILIMVVIGISMGLGSNLGHLGGALGGAAAALAMHVQRFGGMLGRVLGVLLVPLLVIGAIMGLQHVRAENASWEEIEARRLTEKTIPHVRNTIRDAKAEYQDGVEPLIEQRPSRRDPQRIVEAGATLSLQVRRLRELAEELRDSPFRHVLIRPVVDAARKEVMARAVYYAEAIRYLEVGERWTNEEEKAHEAMWNAVKEAESAVAEAINRRSKRKKPD